MRHATEILLAAAAMSAAPAFAQDTLGTLLDANAAKISVGQFERDLVQRVLEGPTQTGGRMEVMYTGSGQIEGTGTMRPGIQSATNYARIQGRWTNDGAGRICTSLSYSAQVGSNVNAGIGMGTLPPRCQYWYKLGDKYFLADSDTDRSAKVLVRTIKQ